MKRFHYHWTRGYSALALAVIAISQGHGVTAMETPLSVTGGDPALTADGVVAQPWPSLADSHGVEDAFPSFNSQVLDKQVLRYRAYVQRFGVPDILIVGSSRAHQGLDPIALAQSLQRRGQGDLKVYNFGINGATAQVVDWLLRELLPPEQLPKLVVWADGVRAFNSGRDDRTYTAIQQSVGYRQVQAGQRPTHVAVQKLNHPPDLAPSLANEFRVASGFSTVKDRFYAYTYYQSFPRVPGEYDSDYNAFTLQGEQTIATHRLAKFLQSQRIALVFVNLPLTADYLDSTRRDREQEFSGFMGTLSQQHGFLFRNLNQQTLRETVYFADPSHLNWLGAAVLAEYLTRDTSIPWQP